MDDANTFDELRETWMKFQAICLFQDILKKLDPSGKPTQSAHPARFSPDDKYSKQRVRIKKRFGLLPTQQPAPVY